MMMHEAGKGKERLTTGAAIKEHTVVISSRTRDKYTSMDLFNSNLKSPALKLKSPASDKISLSNTLVQNDFSPTPRWLKTGRRTTPRKAIFNQEPSFSNHRADDVIQLANEHWSKEHLPLKKRAHFPTSLNAVNTRGSAPNESLVLMEGGQSSAEGSENDEKFGHPDAGTSTDPLVVNEKVDVHKIHTKSPKQYVCDFCDRFFTSYQALGGHKVHHKIKLNREEEATEGTYSFLHICTFCDKIFPTGQALGGHKRHCREPASEKEGPSHGESQEIKNQKKVFRFDLNEPPAD